MTFYESVKVGIKIPYTLFWLLFVLVIFSSGCASKWIVSEQSLEKQQLWPPSPQKPRLQHVMTMTGFAETGTTLKTVVFGREEERFIRPSAVTVARDGTIAIADPGCNCVHLYSTISQKYRKLNMLRDEELVSPVGVVFDEASRLYVSDSVLGKVFVFDSNGDFLFPIDKGQKTTLQRPTGLAYNQARKFLYAVDTLGHRVHAYNTAGEAVFSFGQRGTEKGQFNFPTHIFRADSGRIYVTDAMNFRIQIFDSSGLFLASFGHHGDGSGDFAMPKGIAADRNNIIYVVDNLFDNVQIFNELGEFLLTVGGRGSGPDEFWLPSGIFISDSDRLYVCDTFNQRIQVFSIIREVHEEK